MKKNSYKSVIVFSASFVSVILFFVVYYWSKSRMDDNNGHLKVAGWAFQDLNKLDPANIEDAQQSNLVRSIYSSLLYFDKAGDLQASLAESYQIIENKIYFKIKKNVPIGNGEFLDETDVYDSLKRLVILNKNTHIKLINFLEGPDYTSNDLAGIKISEDKRVIISLKSKNIIKYFLPLLANPDFAIIPHKAVNFSDPNLPIVRFDLTSGPYFISSISSDGSAKFEIKEGHFLSEKSNPKIIDYVPVRGRSLIEAYRKGVVDLIPTYHVYHTKEILSLFDKNHDNLHQTLPINLIYSEFTTTGRERFDSKQRLYIGNLLREKVLEQLRDQLGLSPTREFFGVVGESSLGDTQKKILAQSFINMSDYSHIKFAVDSQVLYPFQLEALVKDLPGAHIPKENEEPDVLISFTDSGFFENLSLLSYTQAKGLFGFSDQEFYSWLDGLVNIVDDKLRFQELQKIHMKLLQEGIAVPIGVSSFYALARKPWSADLYNMFAGTPLWMIHKE